MNPPSTDPTAPGFERSLAIVIGINAYTHGIPPLQNALHDAHAIAETLERQGFEVLRLLDSEATLDRLSRHLSSLQQPLDRFLFYFAGHGLAHTTPEHQFSGFLLPSDARRDDPSTYWPMASLREALRALSCRHLLLILDCCFAGAFPHASRDIRQPAERTPLFLERFRYFSAHRSFQLLVSTSHNELASDRLLSRPVHEASGPERHSPFTLALLEAIGPGSPADINQDGLLTASELYTFLRDRLVDLLPASSRQTPSLWNMDWHDGGEFLFLLRNAHPSLPSAAPLSQHASPYPGPRPFSTAERHLFFGREEIVELLYPRIRSQSLLVLCGPSGTGKSSLVQAGLRPRFLEDSAWLVPEPLQPSTQPLHQLCAWLSNLPSALPVPSPETLATQPHAAAGFLRAFLQQPPERSLLLIVDPLEQLFTSCGEEAPRLAFLRALSSLIHLSHPRLHLLLVLRSDFEPQCLTLLGPAYISHERWRDARYTLPAMSRDALRRCIEEPARVSTLFFTSGLVERLLDDAGRTAGALALLSAVLRELFDALLASGRDDRTFSFAEYHRLGGLTGVLLRHAELARSGQALPGLEGHPSLEPVPPHELPAFQRTLRDVLLRMVSAEGGKLTCRRVSHAELDSPLAEENARVLRTLRLLESLRLVVATEAEGPCVELAHDAVLSAWPQLRNEASHVLPALTSLRRISHAATEWVRHQRAAAFLWADDRLDSLELSPTALRKPHALLELPAPLRSEPTAKPLVLSRTEADFLRASSTHRRRLRARRNGAVLLGALGVLLLAAAWLFSAGQAARVVREAQQRGVQAQTRLVQGLLDKDATQALLALQEVDPLSEDPPQAWLQTALEASQRAISSAILAGPDALSAVAVFSPDGTRLLTTAYDGTARLWRSDGTGPPLLLRGHSRAILSASFSPDGTRVVTASYDGTARIWSTQGAGQLGVLRGHLRALTSATFSPDGQSVLTASYDGTARLWSATRFEPWMILRGHTSWVTSATFSPDGRSVLTASEDGTARLWRLERPETPQVLAGHLSALESASFSPDGSRILTASHDGTARVWNPDGTFLRLQAQPGWIQSARFSPDGSHVLAVSDDGTARLWRAVPGEATATLEGQLRQVTAAAFSPEGLRIVTGAPDGTARLWDAPREGLARVWSRDAPASGVLLQGHTNRVMSVSFNPDGSRILTASLDGSVRLWRPHGALVVLQGPPRRGVSAALSPDGSHLLATFYDGTARLWRTGGPALGRALQVGTSPVTHGVFAPDGGSVLTVTADGTAHLWDLEGVLRRTFQCHPRAITSVVFSADGSHLLTASQDGSACVWSLGGETPPLILRAGGEEMLSASFSPDSRLVLTVSKDGTARLWPVELLKSFGTAGRPPSGPWTLTRQAGRWEVTPSELHGEAPLLRDRVYEAVFSPDGSRILTRAWDGKARLWNTHGWGAPVEFQEAGSTVTSASFSPDGRRVLTTMATGKTHLWGVDGAWLTTFQEDEEIVTFATFHPDGSRVLTASEDGAARVWHTDGLTPPLVLKEGGSAVTFATFTRDGSRVLTVSADGALRLWPVAPEFLRGYLRDATTACLPAETRKRYLLEPSQRAREGHARCESSHGRSQ